MRRAYRELGGTDGTDRQRRSIAANNGVIDQAVRARQRPAVGWLRGRYDSRVRCEEVPDLVGRTDLVRRSAEARDVDGRARPCVTATIDYVENNGRSFFTFGICHAPNMLAQLCALRLPMAAIGQRPLRGGELDVW